MNIVILVLRLIHIVAAFMWFGLSATTLLYIVPATQAAGEAGWRFTKALYTQTKIVVAFPISAALTVVAGILLYLTRDPVQNFSQTGQIILGIGAVIGLLAAGHGAFATGAATRRLVNVVAGASDNAALPKETLQSLEAQNAKFKVQARLSFAMTGLALLFMATARYL